MGPYSADCCSRYFTPQDARADALPALVRIEYNVGTSQMRAATNRRLVPCVSVKNPTPSDWRNLSIGLNAQFYSQQPKGIPAGEVQIAIPLEVFVSRNGSVPFPARESGCQNGDGICAQIESGARAVSEHKMPASIPVRKGTESEEAGWIEGE